MLRGWDQHREQDEWDNSSPPREHHDSVASSPDDTGVLREWSTPAVSLPGASTTREETKQEILEDPLPSEGVCGWIASNGDLRNAGSAPYGIEKNGLATAVGDKGCLSDIKPNSPDNVDVEACSDDVTVTDHFHNNSIRRGSMIQRVMNEFRRPTARFKILVGISLFFVTIFIVAIAFAAASNGNSSVGGVSAPAKGSGLVTSLGVETSPPVGDKVKGSQRNDTGSPSLEPSLPYIELTNLPTSLPTSFPTYDLLVVSTSSPSHPKLRLDMPSQVPSSSDTSSIPSFSPTMTPMTFAPSMDCSDSSGYYLTYNDKPRNCTWLDNGHNGAKSVRKDENCLMSGLGDKCRYTCRLYNGCMNELLSRPDTLTDVNNVIGGEECSDKSGTYMGNNHIPRNCSWIEEDPITSPMKKSLNCGTPENERTELGAMCPGSCAGYNECVRVANVVNDVGSHFIGDTNSETNMNTTNDELDDDHNDDIVPTAEPSIDSTFASPTNVPTNHSNELSKTDLPSAPTCVDLDGVFLTHVGQSHYRKCRWFNRDGDGFDVSEKLRLNCHITEIGLNCLATCGCLQSGSDGKSNDGTWEVEDKPQELCNDPAGLFETNEPGRREQCSWLDLTDSGDRKKYNCGETEIGIKCVCRCPYGHDPSKNVLIQDVVWNYTKSNWDYSSITPRLSKTQTTSSIKSEGYVFDTSGKVLTLTAQADTTVSQQNEHDNYGSSLALQVAQPDDEKHSLLRFDLSIVSTSFHTKIGNAKLRLYSIVGSSSGGVIFKQMSGTNWSENNVTWHTLPGGQGSHELIISFLNGVVADSWYAVDVTAAVKDAIENRKQSLSIRIVPDASDVSFASKESEETQPQLVIDSRTVAPTIGPSYQPSSLPSSPSPPLDCLDHSGKFSTNTGESQSCSWFDIGNVALKKELNCQGSAEASLFCQSQCSAYNGCDESACVDGDGSYAAHTGWNAQCSWLVTGEGSLALEQNCGTEKYPITELGKHCRYSCGQFNGCV